MTSEADPQIQSVLFGAGGHVELSFIEPHHVTPVGVRIQTTQINPGVCEDEIAEVVEAIQALLSAYEVAEANPPRTIPGRR